MSLLIDDAVAISSLFWNILAFVKIIDLPSLSMLAEQGIIFTNYHTAANCAPSRAMLLTGVNNHLAGVPNIPETFAPEQRLSKNYQGVLGDNVVTIATLREDSKGPLRLWTLAPITGNRGRTFPSMIKQTGFLTASDIHCPTTSTHQGS